MALQQQGIQSTFDNSLMSVARLPVRLGESRSLVGLNREFFELLEEQARVAKPTHANSVLLREVSERWRCMNSRARQRVTSCPYLLVDAGFADTGRWSSTEIHRGVCERSAADGGITWISPLQTTPPPATELPFFTVRRAPEFARQVFLYAWHVSQSRNPVVQALLGLPARCARRIGSCTVSQINDIAGRHPEWIRPRWSNQVNFWCELLVAAASGEAIMLEAARMHGVQLLAAEFLAANRTELLSSEPIATGRAVGAGESK